MKVTRQQYSATARFHERMTCAFKQHGKKRDAASARKAEARAKVSADTSKA